MNYDHIVEVTEANCRIEPCCDGMHEPHKQSHNELHYAPMARMSTDYSLLNTNHSSDDGALELVEVERSCCSKMMQESFVPTLDLFLQKDDFYLI